MHIQQSMDPGALDAALNRLAEAEVRLGHQAEVVDSLFADGRTTVIAQEVLERLSTGRRLARAHLRGVLAVRAVRHV